MDARMHLALKLRASFCPFGSDVGRGALSGPPRSDPWPSLALEQQTIVQIRALGARFCMTFRLRKVPANHGRPPCSTSYNKRPPRYTQLFATPEVSATLQVASQCSGLRGLRTLGAVVGSGNLSFPATLKRLALVSMPASDARQKRNANKLGTSDLPASRQVATPLYGAASLGNCQAPNFGLGTLACSLALFVRDFSGAPIVFRISERHIETVWCPTVYL